MSIKQIITVGIAGVAMGAMALDNVEVTDVKARQRYPWNGKVDIDFTLDSKATEPYQMQVEVYDNVGKTNLPVKSVCTENVSVEANPCMVRTDTTRIVWDAAKDLPNGFKCTNVLVTCRDARTIAVSNLYCVIDLTTGAKEYLSGIPKGGWTDEHKTTKMVFRRIEAGSFMMGSPSDEVGRQSNETQHKVTISKPYYIAIFELTEAQYCKICGGSSGSMLPKMMPYHDVRGYGVRRYFQSYTTVFDDTLYSWPKYVAIDPNSLVGVLRTMTTINTLDLPTEAQWEYSCRGETISAISSGDASLGKIARYDANKNDGLGDASSRTITHVGCYMPNAFGIYDMIGNAREWCVDNWTDDLGTSAVSDPSGGETYTIGTGSYRYQNYVNAAYTSYIQKVVKGGGFYQQRLWVREKECFETYVEDRTNWIDTTAISTADCRSAWRSFGKSDYRNDLDCNGNPIRHSYEYTLEGVRLVFSAE